MRRWGLVLAFVLIGATGLVIVPSPAFACTCRQPSVVRSLQESDVVFRGRLVSTDTVTRRGEQRVDLHFEVDAVYKGTAYGTQIVATNDNSAACGFTPDTGTTWIIFGVEGIEGSGDQSVTRVSTSLCSGNLPSGSAPRVLGPPQTPVDGASDTTEKTVLADQRLNRGLAYAGIGVLFVGALAVLGLVWLWRPRANR